MYMKRYLTFIYICLQCPRFVKIFNCSNYYATTDNLPAFEQQIESPTLHSGQNNLYQLKKNALVCRATLLSKTCILFFHPYRDVKLGYVGIILIRRSRFNRHKVL